MKDLIDIKTDDEVLRSMLAEVNKAKNEIHCATRDLEKAKSRLNFLVVLTNKMIDRGKTNGIETTSNQASA